MQTRIQKIILLVCLILNINACSSLNSQHFAAITQPPVTLVIPIHQVNVQGIGDLIGTITFQQSTKGLVITPMLQNLSVGEYAFSIHDSASCNATLATNQHFPPTKIRHHDLPKQEHLGDLPALTVNEDGYAMVTVIAPHLKLADIQEHSIMIYQGGNNDSNHSLTLEDEGARIACGIIQ